MNSGCNCAKRPEISLFKMGWCVWNECVHNAICTSSNPLNVEDAYIWNDSDLLPISYGDPVMILNFALRSTSGLFIENSTELDEVGRRCLKNGEKSQRSWKRQCGFSTFPPTPRQFPSRVSVRSQGAESLPEERIHTQVGFWQMETVQECAGHHDSVRHRPGPQGGVNHPPAVFAVDKAHQGGHPGDSRLKSHVRSHFWIPEG